MIIRPQYMNTLKTYRDVPLVKILAGIRRCGKSTILDMLRDDLLKSGIAADHIISMRYTSEDFDDGMTDKAMYQGIKEQMTDDGRYYLLLDEVQEIDGWEKAVNSLLENADTDIYAVSYTHLDVYKRQPISCARRQGPCTGAHARQAGCIFQSPNAPPAG